jgi:hypothetical protein
MTRKPIINVSASVRARLLKVAKERREDFTLTLINYAAERFLYRLSKSARRSQFVLKGAILFAVQIGEPYRPTRDLDLLGLGEPTEAAINTAISEIAATPVEEDGLVFEVGTLTVHPIREDNRYGGLRAVLQAHLAEARIHVQIDVGFGDSITPAALDLEFPTLLSDMASPHVLAYPTETIVAEKAEAMVDLGIANSRMKDFSDVAVAARRVSFDGESLVAALRATFRRRGTPLPDGNIVALSERFVADANAQANWKAFASRSGQTEFESLERVDGILAVHGPDRLKLGAQTIELRHAPRWQPSEVKHGSSCVPCTGSARPEPLLAWLDLQEISGSRMRKPSSRFEVACPRGSRGRSGRWPRIADPWAPETGRGGPSWRISNKGGPRDPSLF